MPELHSGGGLQVLNVVRDDLVNQLLRIQTCCVHISTSVLHPCGQSLLVPGVEMLMEMYPSVGHRTWKLSL